MKKPKIVVTNNIEEYKKKRKFIKGFAHFFEFLLSPDGGKYEDWVNFICNYYLKKGKQ